MDAHGPLRPEIKPLVAEVDTAYQSHENALVELAGFQKVEMANNGLEAVAAVPKTRYAAVLMDLQMPALLGASIDKAALMAHLD